MNLILLSSLAGVLLGWLMGFLSLFLILLILIQRGKGGGLSGALGGPGGQSAFGSKAGDTFTLITIVTASVWGLVCAFTMWSLGTHAPTIPETNTASFSASGLGEDLTDGLVIPPADGAGGGIGGLDLGSLGEDTAEVTSDEAFTSDTENIDAAEPEEKVDEPQSDEPQSE